MMLVSDPVLVFLLCLVQLRKQIQPRPCRFREGRMSPFPAWIHLYANPLQPLNTQALYFLSVMHFRRHMVLIHAQFSLSNITLERQRGLSVNGHTANWLSLPSLITCWACSALPLLLLGARYVSLNSQESS